VAVASVLLTLSVVWVHGRQHFYMPCETDCGETVLAQDQVALYRVNGLKYGLIQYDGLPTGDLLYTHNVHIGAIVFVLLDAAGLHAFWAKQIVTLGVFGVGLLYVFCATAYFSKSGIGGLIILLLFCFDYEHVLSFGLNALRAWHWSGLFGLAFHIGRLMLEPRSRAIDYAAILVLSVIAFGIGYDFWLICFSMAGLSVLVILQMSSVRAGRLARSGWVLGSLLLPLAIRQVQIATVLGAEFWATDLYYSIGIKVPGLNHLLRLPSLEEVDTFYKANRILRPPASPADSFGSVFNTFVDMINYVVVPSWGLPFCLLAIVIAIMAAAEVIFYRASWYRTAVIRACLGDAIVRRWCLLIAPLSWGILCGLTLLAPFSLHVYLKHQFPLLAALILVPLGCCLGVGSETLIRKRHSGCRSVAIGVATVGLLITYYVLIQVNNARTVTVVDGSWIGFLHRHKQASYALPARPLLYHGDRVDWARIDPSRAREVLERRAHGRPLFEGLILAGSKPRDYWIYQPLDRSVEFDAPSPSCRRQDPALAVVAWLGEKFHRAPGKSATWVLPGSAAPGSRVVLGGTIDAPPQLIERVEVVDAGRVETLTAEDTTWFVGPVRDAAMPIKDAMVNCLRGTFMAEVGVGDDASEGLQRISIRAVYRDGRKFEIGKIIFEVQHDAPRTTQPVVAVPTPHLSVDAIVESNSGLRIAERGRTGEGYVIFDLRRSGATDLSQRSSAVRRGVHGLSVYGVIKKPSDS
jgi:hypothetical protein